MNRLIVVLIVAAGPGTACTRSESTSDAERPSVASRPATEASSAPGSRPASGPATRPDRSAAERRADAGRARLEGSEPGRIVLRGIEAHGGLDAWFSQGALRFRHDYQPITEGLRRTSVQTVDVLTSRVHHDMEHPMRGRIAFDGEKAWMKLAGDAGYPARFWALTPYYFVAMPFVLGDPGVNLARVDDDPKAAGFEAADVVKATFDPGTGDAPGDYYVLYFAKDDGHLLGLRYVVSYAPFFEGRETKHTPEKLLVYAEYEPAGPLTLARRHDFFAFADGKKGEKVTVAEISDVRYGAEFDPAKLHMPEGATVDDSLSKAEDD